ncbi:MAG TPA: Uma2 family endonuclease [Vicinamibacterales bacterium]
MCFRVDDGIVVVVVVMKRSAEAMAAPPLMTVDEYFRTPVTVRPAELRFGILHVAESPSPRHQSAVANLFRSLDAYAHARDAGEIWLAPLDVVLDGERALIVQPDLFFISRGREWIVQDRVRGAPDLVIEVLSPSPRIGKAEERLAWFAEYGIRECWLVHLDRREITVVTFARKKIAGRRVFGRREWIVSAVLPDFSEGFDGILAA